MRSEWRAERVTDSGLQVDMCFHDIGNPPEITETWHWECGQLRVKVCGCGVATYTREDLYQEWWPEGRLRIETRLEFVQEWDSELGILVLCDPVRRRRPAEPAASSPPQNAPRCDDAGGRSDF